MPGVEGIDQYWPVATHTVACEMLWLLARFGGESYPFLAVVLSAIGVGDVHLTPEGNRVVAEELAASLLPELAQ